MSVTNPELSCSNSACCVVCVGVSVRFSAAVLLKKRARAKSKKMNNGFVGEEGVMSLTLIEAHGTKTVRELEGKAKEIQEDGDKSISTFLNPKDVKGTKMLTWSHKNDDDQQWLIYHL